MGSNLMCGRIVHCYETSKISVRCDIQMPACTPAARTEGLIMADEKPMTTHIVEPTDEAGDITFRLPLSVQRAMEQLPSDAQAKIREVLPLVMSMCGHIICGEISRAVRTREPPLLWLATSLAAMQSYRFPADKAGQPGTTRPN